MFALLFLLTVSVGSAQASSFDTAPATNTDPPGSLLDTPFDSSVPVGIAPAVEEIEPIEVEPRGGTAQLEGGGADGDVTFHIINGPNKSTTFKGRHYSGQILHSSYQQLPWTGEIWHHYEWGPNKSLYHK